MARTRTQEPKPLARYFQISSRSHHGLIFAVEVARGGRNNAPVSIRSVAQRVGLSEGYLEELAGILRAAGIIRGARGRGGGYTLAQSPQHITMGDLVRLLDGPVVLAHCQDTTATRPCPAEDRCASRHFFSRLKAAIDRELDTTTLADLTIELKNGDSDRSGVLRPSVLSSSV